MSKNASDADNQQGSLPMPYRNDPSETTRRNPAVILENYSWEMI